MSERIAVVGLGLRYPDADTVGEFWDNILAGRRAFRDIPEERMNLTDYYASDPAAPDRIYSRKAALLRNFTFDRAQFKISGPTFRSTDMTHWLALTVAAEAWHDAGVPTDLREHTAVIVGNTLTGEFSRANIMRLRWPYVRRVVGKALEEQHWSNEQVQDFLQTLESDYKAPFPPITEDSLAGGLSNTIAGRICNYFDFHGGAYTVDGACSSSLISIITAARSLTEGDISVAIAGGVDLSIDPFETIGFAKTGALATGTMKVYDRDSNGFWPGEGCGMVVLMRESDAIDVGMTIYATITGWGVSSDGHGGITRPEAEGHIAAIGRAYRRAGYAASTVDYFEGHGTGTAVGDATEIRAIGTAIARSDAAVATPPRLGSVKGNIGHTKAAAGVAGFIKAALVAHHGVIPPATGHDVPSPALADVPIDVPTTAIELPSDRPARTGVSSMGFGGSNAHIAIESAPHRTAGLDIAASTMVAARQDAELLTFAADSSDDLAASLAAVESRLPALSMAELTDLAADLARGARDNETAACRASVVATSPDHAATQLARLRAAVLRGEDVTLDDGVSASLHRSGLRLGFLFPGQGSGSASQAFLARRFPDFPMPHAHTRPGSFVDTHVAQPRIASQSAHALAVLRSLGLEASVATGHSLGELTSLHWGGVFDADQLVDLAALRGEVMARHSTSGGTMASLQADAETAQRLIDDHGSGNVVIAGRNAPEQTVISGDRDAVEAVVNAATARRIGAQQLRVSHAFHSAHVDTAASEFGSVLAKAQHRPLTETVISTVTGKALQPDIELSEHLATQMRAAVDFTKAIDTMATQVDMFLEVGPGRTLSTLASFTAPDIPSVSVEADAASAVPFLTVLGTAWTFGAVDAIEHIFHGRVVRELPAQMSFLASPCESAPDDYTDIEPANPLTSGSDQVDAESDDTSVLDALRRIFANHAELPLHGITADLHPIDDLHLSSITVSQLAAEAAIRTGRDALPASTNLATITIGELAEALESADIAKPDRLEGVDSWVRSFQIVPQSLRSKDQLRQAHQQRPGRWRVYSDVGQEAAVIGNLEHALTEAGIGSGALVYLTGSAPSQAPALVLAAAQEVTTTDLETLVVLIDSLETSAGHSVGHGAEALAKSFALESPDTNCLILKLPLEADPCAHVPDIAAEIHDQGPDKFREVTHGRDGSRTRPMFRLYGGSGGQEQPLQAGDLLLVSGGAKGIVAESVITLVKRWNVSVGLLGRADADQDDEVRGTLDRLADLGASFTYVQADVRNDDEVRSAIAALERQYGPTRGILHGAGTNQPTSITALTHDDLDHMVAVKAHGLRHLMDAVDPAELRLLVSYASIIGRTGMHGEAHYAAANAQLTELTEEIARTYPHIRARSLEWSVWAGSGMGVRLGVLESLERSGIAALPLQSALDTLVEIAEDPAAPVTLLVGSRLGSLRTAIREQHDIPLRRFLESIRLHYPGIELIADVDLGLNTDPYLADHDLNGDVLFPAVFGLEAMTEVAHAVTGSSEPLDIVDAQFLRPIRVKSDEGTKIRVAALVEPGGAVRLAVRSSETSWSADHFRATLAPATSIEPAAAAMPDTGWVDATHLYGPLFFQGARFQRVTRYRHIAAREAVAELAVTAPGPWFARHLPSTLVLGDPGTRDAIMHALQCCVPDAVLLPVGVGRIQPAGDFGDRPVLLHAKEIDNTGDDYIYDVAVADANGRVIERWHRLHLRAVNKQAPDQWEPQLLGPHLQRTMESLGVTGVSVALADTPNRADGAHEAVIRAAGRSVVLRHGADGRPLIDGMHVSIAHTAQLSLAMVADAVVGCDIEQVAHRDVEAWSGMLGERLWDETQTIAGKADESVDTSATRVWAALECLRKVGIEHDRLAMDRIAAPGWVIFTSPGEINVLTGCFEIAQLDQPVVVSVLAIPDSEQAPS